MKVSGLSFGKTAAARFSGRARVKCRPPRAAIPSDSDRLAESLGRRLLEFQIDDDVPGPFEFPDEQNPMETAEQSSDATVDAVDDGAEVIADPTRLPDAALPKVALVGRPNVGKSALFNRLSKTTKAIVYDKPGITRDRLFVRAFWGATEFMLIDTGGLPDTKELDHFVPTESVAKDEQIPLGVELQVASAVGEADVVIMVVDGRMGPTGGDQEILEWLRGRHSTKPVFMAVNKCENYQQSEIQAAAFWEYGSEPYAVSAITGHGTGDLLDKVVKALPPPKTTTTKEAEKEDAITAVAILGRPNTGKSSLLNMLVGEERSIVSSVAGTTRDAVDSYFTLPSGDKVKVIDTAGIRKRMAVHGSKEKVEPVMVERAIKALREANVAILMLDISEGITQQDYRLSQLAAKEGCAVVVVGNKWDMMEDERWTREMMDNNIHEQLREVSWAQVVVTSLKEEDPVRAITKGLLKADRGHAMRVSTATLNLVIQEAVNWRPPPGGKRGKKGRIYYATQPSSRPPTFILFVNDASLFSDEYKRYLEGQLRENIGFDGTPIRLLFRGKPPREDPRA